MSLYVNEKNLSVAWLRAARELLDLPGGKAVNLAVSFPAVAEDGGLRGVLDDFIGNLRSLGVGKKPWPISTVANTIFPAALYMPAKLGERAEDEVYRLHALERSVRIRRPDKEEYFDRLVAWPGREAGINQLRNIVCRLRKCANGVNVKSSIYELAVHDPERSQEISLPTCFEDLRIYHPEKDRRIMGFPCLSHISLTVKDGQLNLSALYRNQHFLRRSYGNYLGLLHLTNFLAKESGMEAGEIICLATHADLELGSSRGLGHRSIKALLDKCEEALSDT